MPPKDLPAPVEDMLADLADYDAAGALEDYVRGPVMDLRRQWNLRGKGDFHRAQLALILTGDEASTLALAAGYAQALHDLDMTEGGDDGTKVVLHAVRWRDLVADEQGNPLPFGKALDRLYAAKMEAEGGVLVIRDIYDQPPNAANRTAVDQAQNGAYQMLHDLMTEYAGKTWTPVVVLTGDPAKMETFLHNNRHVADYFPPQAIRASAPPPPPPSVETEHDVRIIRPLRLVRPGLS